MCLDIRPIEWEYEDELPEMSNLEYKMIYNKSRIVYGFRMFPFVRDWDHEKNIERKIYLSD
jgi:hypothetical protein